MDAFDGVAFIVQEALDAAEEGNIFGGVVAAAACAGEGFDVFEFTFPKTEDVGGDAQLFGDLADGAVGRLRFTLAGGGFWGE